VGGCPDVHPLEAYDSDWEVVVGSTTLAWEDMLKDRSQMGKPWVAEAHTQVCQCFDLAPVHGYEFRQSRD
jgi:hypothetical protein